MDNMKTIDEQLYSQPQSSGITGEIIKIIQDYLNLSLLLIRKGVWPN